MFLKRPVLKQLLKQYLVLLLILVLFVLTEFLFWMQKNDGNFSLNSVVRSIAVGVVFFANGFETKPKEIWASVKQWQLHALILFLNFIMTPVLVRFGLIFVPLLTTMDKWIITGFLALGCMPPPISSAVLLTRTSGGNGTVAVVASTLGTVLGIFLTPLLLLFHVGLSCTMPVVETLMNLLMTALGPYFAGLLAQKLDCPIQNAFFKKFLPQFAFFAVIFSSFCEIFGQVDLVVSAFEVLSTLILGIVVQIAMIYLYLRVAFEVDSAQAFTTPDFVALIFCSTHKSLTLGLPLLKTLYGGYSHLSQISLPLLIYHPVQLLIGALLSPFAHKWIATYLQQ